MAWRLIGNKPLSEPMLTRSTDAYMRHWGRWVNGHICDNMRQTCHHDRNTNAILCTSGHRSRWVCPSSYMQLILCVLNEHGWYFANDISKCIFLLRKLFWNFIEVLLSWIPLPDNIDLDNGSAPNRRQTMAQSNDDLIHWCIHASWGFGELRLIQGLSATTSQGRTTVPRATYAVKKPCKIWISHPHVRSVHKTIQKQNKTTLYAICPIYVILWQDCLWV